MTLFAMFQRIYIDFDEQELVFVGIFATQQDAEQTAKQKEIIYPDIRTVIVGEYISPY